MKHERRMVYYTYGSLIMNKLLTGQQSENELKKDK